MAVPLWLREKLYLKNLLIKEFARLDRDVDWERRMLFSEHHLSHATSAYFASPILEATVLTLDGVGEWATTRVGFRLTLSGRLPTVDVTGPSCVNFPAGRANCGDDSSRGGTK